MTKNLLNSTTIIAGLMILNNGCALYLPCEKIPIAKYVDDQIAKKFDPTKDKAVIYFYRELLPASEHKISEIKINNSETHNLMCESFIRIELKPGFHKFSSSYNHISSELDIITEANKLYYFKMGRSRDYSNKSILFGYSIKFQLQQIPELDAQFEIKKCRLVQ